MIFILPLTHSQLLNLLDFLNMYVAFDKVWHKGLIFKLKPMVICDALLDLIESFLGNRFQRVALNGPTSERLPVKASAPQGSILGPVFFLIYINDLSIDIISIVKLFADDTSLFSIIHDATTTAYELKICRKYHLNGNISEKCHLIQA